MLLPNLSVDVKTNCLTLMLNICPDCDRHKISKDFHLFLGQCRDQRRAAQFGGKINCQAFFVKYWGFSPWVISGVLSDWGSKVSQNPSHTWRGDIEPHQISSRGQKWGRGFRELIWSQLRGGRRWQKRNIWTFGNCSTSPNSRFTALTSLLVSHHDLHKMQRDGGSKGYQAKYKQVSI